MLDIIDDVLEELQIIYENDDVVTELCTAITEALTYFPVGYAMARKIQILTYVKLVSLLIIIISSFTAVL